MQYKPRCPVCMKIFHTPRSNVYLCSDWCKDEYMKQEQGKLDYQGKIPSSTTGAISELRIATDLMAKGYHVFRALSASCPQDLIIKHGDSVKSIECRTGQTSKSGNLSFPKKDSDVPDIFAVFIPRTSDIFYFDSDGKTSVDFDDVF
jgi:hypothetical protein